MGEALDDQAEELSAQLDDGDRQPDAHRRKPDEAFREHVGY